MKEPYTLEAIYKRYFEDVYRYIFSLSRNQQLAEDVTQDTFYRLYSLIDEVPAERIKAWLFRVAYNAFIDVIRKEKIQQSYWQKQEVQTARSAAEDVYISLNISQYFQYADQLSETQRNILLLRDYYNFSYDEISLMTGFSLANVKVQLFRARKVVHAKMKEEFK